MLPAIGWPFLLLAWKKAVSRCALCLRLSAGKGMRQGPSSSLHALRPLGRRSQTAAPARWPD